MIARGSHNQRMEQELINSMMASNIITNRIRGYTESEIVLYGEKEFNRGSVDWGMNSENFYWSFLWLILPDSLYCG